jgi:hypothetical protein
MIIASMPAYLPDSPSCWKTLVALRLVPSTAFLLPPIGKSDAGSWSSSKEGKRGPPTANNYSSDWVWTFPFDTAVDFGTKSHPDASLLPRLADFADGVGEIRGTREGFAF